MNRGVNMNESSTSTLVIQNKVFGSLGEHTRWAQLKTYRSQSAVTRYLHDWLVPLGQNDNYRIAVSRNSGAGSNHLQYLSIDDWLAARNKKSSRTSRIHS